MRARKVTTAARSRRRLLFLLLLSAGVAGAQPLGPATEPARADSLTPRPDTRSPGVAVLLSALLPGAGQVYTGKWWKACIIAPAELALAGLAVQSHRVADEALKEGREDRYIQFRERRNTFLYFTGAVLAFSMADAYVSARMYGFERQMRFAVGPGRAGVSARIGLLQ